MSDASETTPTKWVKGMKSPHPAGRPKGIVDKRRKLRRVFTDNGEGLVQTAVNAALAGDMQALSMALARVVPPSRHRPSGSSSTSTPICLWRSKPGKSLSRSARGSWMPKRPAR
jgi:hypothetical protein